jgi:uncharacterized protein (TIGR00661 family)
VRILYGVVGEGMGHATRSAVVLDHLLARGHEVRVVVSGRAHGFLRSRFRDRPRFSLDEIHGLVFAYRGKGLDRSASLRLNLERAPAGLLRNLRAWRRVAEDGFLPEAVVSDFESWSHLYGVAHGVPVLSVDNVQALARLRHPRAFSGARREGLLARASVRVKVPGAYHYLVTSFFYPPVARSRTTLVPPILRPEVLALRREPRDHVLVYQTASSDEGLVPALRGLPGRFVVYGMGRAAREGNVTLKAFSGPGFLEDLRTARAVLAGGGFSLMSEAVHLRVPVLSRPVEGQVEQEMNGFWLERLGYGARATAFDGETVGRFLEGLPRFAEALASYHPRDNGMTMGCLDEVLGRAARGERAPARLESPNLGGWRGR